MSSSSPGHGPSSVALAIASCRSAFFNGHSGARWGALAVNVAGVRPGDPVVCPARFSRRFSFLLGIGSIYAARCSLSLSSIPLDPGQHPCRAAGGGPRDGLCGPRHGHVASRQASTSVELPARSSPVVMARDSRTAGGRWSVATATLVVVLIAGGDFWAAHRRT